MLFVIRSSAKLSTKYPLLTPRQQFTKQDKGLRRIRFAPESTIEDRPRAGKKLSFRPYHPGVARSLDYMARHWRRAIKVTDLARAARMSRRGYLKAFLRHTGGTPARRVRAIRLENVRRLLLGGGDRLEIIARQSGFRSVNSLSIAFKREIGVAPIQFRKNSTLWKRWKRDASTVSARRISNHVCRNLNGNL